MGTGSLGVLSSHFSPMMQPSQNPWCMAVCLIPLLSSWLHKSVYHENC